MEIYNSIPKELINFVLVAVFSLLIGLSQRRLHNMAHEEPHTFGTDRTFTFIGILGYLLFLLDNDLHLLFLGGGLILGTFFAIFYFFHLKNLKDYGITTVLIALITYCIGPMLQTQPHWFVLLIVVTVLMFTEMKEMFISITQKFDRDEFLNLAKFLIIAGVILPLVPDTPVLNITSLSPYRIWLAVVVISSISYISYLLKKFIFPNASIILSGILGGMYSSTATTLTLGRKIKSEPHLANQYLAAILFATAMMYLRIMILIAVFNMTLLGIMWKWLVILFLLTVVTGIVILFYHKKQPVQASQEQVRARNPLEFKVALIFTGLYIVFVLLTDFVIRSYGITGLNVLSFLVGLTDIDPFLISMFQGKYAVATNTIALATFQAIISNNVLKMIYGCAVTEKKNWLYLASGFMVVIAVNILIIFLI